VGPCSYIFYFVPSIPLSDLSTSPSFFLSSFLPFFLSSPLMQGTTPDPDAAMARIFVWLRYSAIRQLTWQRNYNTQPRILGAAQERLTSALADAAGRLGGAGREWARLALATLGRGGNAQAVRDEILNIMHRNKISEVKGTWMEEWHQKLQ
jgi:hypothetical protein